MFHYGISGHPVTRSPGSTVPPLGSPTRVLQKLRHREVSEALRGPRRNVGLDFPARLCFKRGIACIAYVYACVYIYICVCVKYIYSIHIACLSYLQKQNIKLNIMYKLYVLNAGK
jgi:hypothetical protein